jgi:hypothetical protein
MPLSMAHPHSLEPSNRPAFALRCAHVSSIGQRQLHVFENCKVADKIKTLKNEANLSVANARAFGEGELLDLSPLQQVLTFRRRIEQAENGKKS